MAASFGGLAPLALDGLQLAVRPAAQSSRLYQASLCLNGDAKDELMAWLPVQDGGKCPNPKSASRWLQSPYLVALIHPFAGGFLTASSHSSRLREGFVRLCSWPVQRCTLPTRPEH
jgi:hypothetical protein